MTVTVEYAIASIAFFIGGYVASFKLPYWWLGIVLGILGVLFLLAVVDRLLRGD